jgi:L-serine kinase (ATP) / ParB family transcriptional regulator, heme-responsive regulator
MDTHLKSEPRQIKFTDSTPDLRVVETSKIIPHEVHDSQRSEPLITSLQQEGVLKNPPIVTELDSDNGTFVVLDGANRSTAFAELGIRHSLVQVVPYEPPFIELLTWHHVVSGVPIAELVNHLSSHPDLALGQADHLHAKAELARRAILAYYITLDGQVITMVGGGLDLNKRTELLHHIVNAYLHKGRLDRTNHDRVDELRQMYPQMTCAVIFPHYELVEVMDVARSGLTVPPGLTRHIIHGRVLRVNYPLERLTAHRSLEEKNAELQAWLQERFQKRQVRYYAESTYLFDE